METLQVWGDSSALVHISHEQHIYLTKAILICMGFLSDKQIQENKDGIVRLLNSLPGYKALDWSKWKAFAVN